MDTLNQDLSGFWGALCKLVSSGVPLLKALESAGKDLRNPELKNAVDDLAEEIRNGASLSEGLAKHPRFFPDVVVTIMRAGELKGQIDIVMQKIIEGIKDGSITVDVSAQESSPIEIEKKQDTGDKPDVVKALNTLLLDAIKKQASDIHIEWLDKGLRIRLRIDGVLKEIPAPPEELSKALVSRIKVMAHLDVAEKRMPQDGRIQLRVSGKVVDLRVATSPAITGEGVVIRILSQEHVSLDMDRLGLSDAGMEQIKTMAGLPNGIVIFTGPTGCGKTTTMYSVLNEINSESIKIITIEDPVEYQINGLVQTQVQPSKGMTFERGIRSALRQDPDVMLIAEIRNREIAYLVMQVALTGHLVFTALHTNDSVNSIRRLLDIGVEPFLVNSTLAGVVSQRLVRRICQKCKEEYKPEAWVQELAGELGEGPMYQGTGCDACFGSGFKGRAAIYEILTMNNELRQLVARQADANALREQAIADGMVTLSQDGLAKARAGITTVEEVMRVAPPGAAFWG